jgi:hypothetical protein
VKRNRIHGLSDGVAHAACGESDEGSWAVTQCVGTVPLTRFLSTEIQQKKPPRKHELFGHSEEKLRAESRLLPIYRTHNK